MGDDSEMWLGKSRTCGWASTKKGEIGGRLSVSPATGPLSRAHEYLKYTDENLAEASLFLLNSPAIGSVWEESGARGPQWS